MVPDRRTRTATPFHGLVDTAANSGYIGKVDFELHSPSGRTLTLILVHQCGRIGRALEVSTGKPSVINNVFAEVGVPPVADFPGTRNSLAADGYTLFQISQVHGRQSADP